MVLIGTDRLRVRPLTVADEPHVLCYAARDDYCPHVPADPENSEGIEAYIRGMIRPEGLRDDTALVLAIVPGGVGRPAGTITLTVDPFPVPIGRLDFTLDPEFRGQGYIVEALEAVLPQAFREMGLLRLCGAADVDDADCREVFEQLGMTEVKCIPDYRTIKGQKRDAFLYVLDAQAPDK